MPTPTRPTAHTPTAIVAIPASERGALAGFSSTCSCGLVMANSIHISLVLDVQGHLRWAAGQKRAAR